VRTVTRATVLAALALPQLPGPAHAFHSADTFDAPALDGGGGRQYFTGAPRDRGYDCTICHADATGEIRIALASEPPELATDHLYVAGRTYHLTVALTGAHRGLRAPRDRNGFALEIVDEDGAPAGTLAATEAGVHIAPEAGVALSDGQQLGQSVWTLSWTAPPTGPVRLHVAGVDGDGGGSDATDGSDPYGDDAWSGAFAAVEASSLGQSGDVAAPRGLSSPACRQVGGAGSGAAAWLAVAIAVVLGRRVTAVQRGRRHRRASIGVHRPASPVVAARQRGAESVVFPR